MKKILFRINRILNDYFSFNFVLPFSIFVTQKGTLDLFGIKEVHSPFAFKVPTEHAKFIRNSTYDSVNEIIESMTLSYKKNSNYEDIANFKINIFDKEIGLNELIGASTTVKNGKLVVSTKLINKTEKSFFNNRVFKKWIFPKNKHFFLYILNNFIEYVNYIEKSCAEYELQISEHGKTRALYNYLNFILHHFGHHGSMRLSKSQMQCYFIASVVHPVYDDYIDQEDFRADFPSRFSKFVTSPGAGAVVGLNNREESIFRLLKSLHSFFPISHHAMLWGIINDLHDAQIDSVAQKSFDIESDRLLNISFRKGGFAFAFFGYIIGRGFTEGQFHHYFQMGAYFQLMDDLHDIDEDMKESIATVFTQELVKNKSVKKSLIGTIGVLREIEKLNTIEPSFKNPEVIKFIQMLGARYDLVRFIALSVESISPDVRLEFESMGLSSSQIKFFTDNNFNEDLISLKGIANDLLKTVL